MSQFAPWIVVIGAGFFAYTLWIVARATIQSRRGTYYFMREDALRRARRWLLAGVVFFALSIVVSLVLAAQPQPIAIADTFTPAAVASTSPTKTKTPKPSPTPTDTATPAPTAKPITSNTATPTIKPGSVPDLLLTPMPSAVPAAPSAKFTLTTLASVLDSKQNPVDAGTVFPQGTHTIHIFFRASGVNNGARWAVFCLKGTRVVDNFIDLWKWGPIAQPSHAVCSIDGSLGTYTVTSYLDFNKQFETTFTLVVPPPTAIPTAAPTAAP